MNQDLNLQLQLDDEFASMASVDVVGDPQALKKLYSKNSENFVFIMRKLDPVEQLLVVDERRMIKFNMKAFYKRYFIVYYQILSMISILSTVFQCIVLQSGGLTTTYRVIVFLCMGFMFFMIYILVAISRLEKRIAEDTLVMTFRNKRVCCKQRDVLMKLGTSKRARFYCVLIDFFVILYGVFPSYVFLRSFNAIYL